LQPKRKRGAPYGNQNAVKHGFYSRKLDPADRLDLDIAAGVEGVDEEIALLRLQIRKAVSGGNVAHLVPLAKTALALEKLIRTRHLVLMEKRQTLKLAVESVLRNVLLPLGHDVVDSTATRYLSGRNRPDDIK
jgi:hypothetical protein